jgi:4-amino-4-deoxy-L-arabinose transferase-like glycosyltransferase
VAGEIGTAAADERRGRRGVSARDLWFAVAVAAVAAVAVGLRVWWAQYSPAVPEPPRFDDSVFYFNIARSIAEGRGFTHPASGLATAQWPPGYPAFLAAIFTLTGPSVTAVEIANAILGGVTAALTAALALLLTWRRAAAVAAALAAALMPSLIMIAGVAWSETLFTTLFVAGLTLIALIPRLDERRRLIALAALALVIAAATLTREAGLVLGPVAAAYGAWSYPDAWRPWLARAAACTVAAVVLILPWTVRNYAILDLPVFVSSSSAGNFWEGHHGSGVSNDIVIKYGPLNRPGGEADVNRAMWREGLKYAATHPWDEFTAIFTKTENLYRGDHAGLNLNDGYGYLPFMSASTRDRWQALSDAAYYGLLALASAGLLVSGWRSPLMRLLVPVVAFWTAGHVAFFTDPRFHLPLLPVFGVAAGAAVAWALDRVSARRPTDVAIGATYARWALLAAAAAAALSGAALLVARQLGSSSTATEGRPLPVEAAPPVVYARELCTLSNEDARAALVQGADGGMSVVVGDKTWWLFGDTLFLAESGKQIEQNSIAWSDELRPDGCPRLYYYAPDGVALPFLPKDGSLTVWPAGAWPVDDRSFDFYTAYVYGSGPYAYTIGEVGLARLDTDTMQVPVLARRLWDEASGFSSQVLLTQPIEIGDDGKLRIALFTKGGATLLARADPARLAEPGAYEFWDGAKWSGEERDAAPLWPRPQAADDLQELATFENGASIAWNEALRTYVAVVNTGYASFGARTADRLEGPWSEPASWLDCLSFAEPRVPTCYSPLQHPSMTADGGRTVVTTVTRMDRYEAVMDALTIGTAIHEYVRGDEVRYGASPPGDDWRDNGVPYYASAAALPGFVPVYGWSRGGEWSYAAAAPDGSWNREEVAFYAAPSARVDGSLTAYRPVYAWRKGTTQLLSQLATGLEQYGYAREDVMFYAP